MLIYAVCYSNYHPREIDSLWLHEADAEKHLENLEGDWRIYEMEVNESAPNKREPYFDPELPEERQADMTAIIEQQSALDKVLEVYRDTFGIKSDRANDTHRDACAELADLRARLERAEYKLRLLEAGGHVSAERLEQSEQIARAALGQAEGERDVNWDENFQREIGDVLFEFEKTQGVQFTNYQRVYLLDKILRVVYAARSQPQEPGE